MADDEALRLSATAPAAAWELGPTAQVKWTCGAGQRNADASECLAAVVAATGVAANGHIKLANSVAVPPGCSYSRVSGAAIFNAGAGQVGSDKENYQLVCTPSPRNTTDSLPSSSSPSIDLVVNAYNEDLSFVDSIQSRMEGSRLRLYCGMGGGLDTGGDERCTTVLNYGAENYAFLRHVVDNYDHLADITVFTMGSAAQHGRKKLARSRR